MRLPAVSLALLAALAGAPARAAEPQVRRTGLHHADGRLAVSVGLQDLLGPAESQRLMSGLTSRVVIRVALYEVGQRDPIAIAIRHSEILYDLWDERFRVRRSDLPWAGVPETREVRTAADAIWEATALVRFPVGTLADLRRGVTYRLAFRADLNPISQELLGQVRRWLARPPAAGRLSRGDSFFGSFVSFFVNPRIEDSDRQVTFYSQTFEAR